MKLYFPEAFGGDIKHIGYNHAISLLKKALIDHFVSDPSKADYRIYCNLPWHHNPAELKKEGLPLMAYTMYESTRVPEAWVNFLNKHIEVVLTPSSYSKAVFRQSGVTRPIHILPLFCDADEAGYSPKFNNGNEPYIYMWQGVAYDPCGRKGVDVVVRAFTELKKEKRIEKDSRLVLKYLPYKSNKLIIDRLDTPLGIVYIQKNMTPGAMNKLYANVDCCVNPTHGEGFGLIPLEQMARCKPVLVTDYSMDYVKEPYCIPLKHELKKSPVSWNHKHFSISLNRIGFNPGGLYHEFDFLPNLLKSKPTNNALNVGVKGIEKTKQSWHKNAAAHVNNALKSLQKKTGLYLDTRRKLYTLYQEFQGNDAHVDIEYLKDKMEWCHNNTTLAEDMGFMACEYVKSEWGIDKMRDAFENITLEIGA